MCAGCTHTHQDREQLQVESREADHPSPPSPAIPHPPPSSPPSSTFSPLHYTSVLTEFHAPLQPIRTRSAHVLSSNSSLGRSEQNF